MRQTPPCPAPSTRAAVLRLGPAQADRSRSRREIFARIRTKWGTVLGSEHPVRVFQNFATLDLVSGGRAELIAGGGSFTESFPMFGYDVADYADLFREKLDALLAIRAESPARWTGGRTPATSPTSTSRPGPSTPCRSGWGPVGFYANGGDFDGTLVLDGEVYSRVEDGVADVLPALRAGAEQADDAAEVVRAG